MVRTDPARARVAVCAVFTACGAGFATWAARVPAAQQRLGLDNGALAIGLFGLAAGSVLALLGSGPLIATLGSRRGVLIGACTLCAGLPAIAWAPAPGAFVAALVVLGMGNSVLDVAMSAHAARGRGGLVPFTRCVAVVAVAGFALVTSTFSAPAGVVGFAAAGLGVSAIVPLAWSAASRRRPAAR